MILLKRVECNINAFALENVYVFDFDPNKRFFNVTIDTFLKQAGMKPPAEPSAIDKRFSSAFQQYIVFEN